jgi:ribose 5-phosphate isomerase A
VLSAEERIAAERDAVGRAGADLVEDGMAVGLGSGRTAERFVEHLAARQLAIRCIATSPATDALARTLGLDVYPYEDLDRLGPLDLAVDGADQVVRDGWLVKGGGGAHRRERAVAEAARRFAVIVDSTKTVHRIGPPIPLELDPAGVADALADLRSMGGAAIRAGQGPSPDGGVIADYLGPVDDPAELADRLAAVPGMLAHGLFPPVLVRTVLVGRDSTVERLR